MKNAILLFISTVILLSSCKKENNRIGNATYQLDSVRIDYLDENDSSTDNFTFQISNEIFDTFLSLNSYASTGNIGFYYSSDSLIYLNHPEFFDLDRYVIQNKLPRSYMNYSPHGSFAQDGYEKSNYYFNYNSIGKLDTVISITKHSTTGMVLDSDYVVNRYKIMNFNNNNLTSINENITYFIYNMDKTHYDSTSVIYPNLSSFLYTNNYQNQKSMIGIDLNDLVLNTVFDFEPSIYGFSYSSVNISFINTIFIIYNNLTYNTNCNSLIESYTYKNYELYNYTLFPLTKTATIDYTFDDEHEKRVSKMKITLSRGFRTGVQYTFYYKD